MSAIKDNSYGLADLQEVLLSMIKDIHLFCQKNQIRYSLAGGSLLGAVRHQGFIPWDDDIDIMMDRENFERFLTIRDRIKGYSVKRVLWVYRIRRNEDLAKKNPPTIDIFVMDHAPDNKIIRGTKVFMLRTLQGMMKEKPDYQTYAPLYRLLVFVTYTFGRCFSDEKKYRFYNRVSQIGNNKNSQYAACYNDLYKLLTVCYDADSMDGLCTHAFEDTELCITEKYDSYLTRQYGDYMTPPPENERVPIHTDI